MRPFGTLLPFEEAERIIATDIEPIARVETISIDGCLGRVLAEAIIATRSTPPFDRAAMDGYALKARDTFGVSRQNPRMLDVVDVLYAGARPQRRLARGESIQIATGARMPQGADAVVMVEDVSLEDDRIKVFKSVYPKANLALKGEDIKKGELVLKEGFVLNPAKIGVLASQGISRVRVYEKPKIAVIPTGEEIGEVGKRLRQGQIYDINSYTVSAVVEENGCAPIKFGIVGDNPQEIKATIKEALEADLVVFSGGSSVGEKDLLFGILKEMGEVLFHGIQIKPGKPTLFALVSGKPVLGMPGYPTSCLLNAYLLLLPALRKMARLLPKRRVTVAARLGERVPGSLGRRQFLPVRLEADTAMPIFKESGAITSTATADGYIVIAENTDILEKGEPVTVTLF
ncbi:Molybdopterin molybdenumtransferase [subsurface metagenome]